MTTDDRDDTDHTDHTDDVDDTDVDDTDTDADDTPGADGDAEGDLVPLGRNVPAIGQRITVLEDRVEDLAGGLDAIETLISEATALLAAPTQTADPAPAGAAAPGAGGTEEPGLDIRTLVAWVEENIAYLLERRVPQNAGFPRWCPRWWLHPEAIARFEALRRMWTDAVGDPGGGLVIYFEHLDQMLAVLGADYGPFTNCNPTDGHDFDQENTFLGQEWPDAAYFAEIEGDLGIVHTLPAAGA